MAVELKAKGHEVSQRTICDLLNQMHFSLQSTRKTREGGKHEDRDAQFSHIAKTVADYQAAGDPVISVDTKKKELIGDFKNAGREWQPAGTPEEVRVYDFIDPELGKVAPYGVYDLIPIRIKNDNCVASPCRAAALSTASRLVLLSNANWN